MEHSDTFQTKSSRVYAEMKRDITNGAFRPGAHLVRRDLVKRFGVSLSIVNEALGRLGNDGLVETKEMYGTRVIALNGQTLREEFVLREAIERHVVRLLAEEGADELFKTLLDDARTIDRWMNELGHDEGQGSLLHLEFHLKLARSTGVGALEDSLKRTSIRALLTTRWLKNQRLPHPRDFHEQLVRVIMKRDPNLADAKMREHLHFAEDDLREVSAVVAPSDG
jgi:DNA-binding GntR family transcriptional regulator